MLWKDETAPPPVNPQYQYCIEEYLFAYCDLNGDLLRGHVETLRGADLSVLPEKRQQALYESLDRTIQTFGLVAQVRQAETDRISYEPEYRPLHRQVRRLQAQQRRIELEIDELKQDRIRISQNDNPDPNRLHQVEAEIEKAKTAITELQMQIPESWTEANKGYTDRDEAEKKARRNYRSNVDKAYETIAELKAVLENAEDLAAIEPQLTALEVAIVNDSAENAMELIKESERALSAIAGTSDIKSKLSKARRALKGKNPEPEKAIQELGQGLETYATEVDWRSRAAGDIYPALVSYDKAIKNSIGLRWQQRIPPEQIKAVASCKSVHRDRSLQF